MKKLLLIVLSTSLLLGSCNFIGNTFNKKKKQRELAEKARLDSIAWAKADSIQKAEELQLQLEQARLDSLQKAEEAELAKAKQKYYVIAGSFKIPNNATKYAKTMSCKGYDSEIIEGKNGFKYVSVGSFKTFASAANLVKQIRDNDEFVVWIHYPTKNIN